MSLSSSVAEIEKLRAVFSFVVLGPISANTGAWLLLTLTITPVEAAELPDESRAVALKV